MIKLHYPKSWIVLHCWNHWTVPLLDDVVVCDDMLLAWQELAGFAPKIQIKSFILPVKMDEHGWKWPYHGGYPNGICGEVVLKNSSEKKLLSLSQRKPLPVPWGISCTSTERPQVPRIRAFWLALARPMALQFWHPHPNNKPFPIMNQFPSGVYYREKLE